VSSADLDFSNPRALLRFVAHTAPEGILRHAASATGSPLAEREVTAVAGAIKEACERRLFSSVEKLLFLAIARGGGSLLNERRIRDLLRPSKQNRVGLSSLVHALQRLAVSVEHHGDQTSASTIRSWSAFVELYRRTRLDEDWLIERLRVWPSACAFSLAIMDESFRTASPQRLGRMPRSGKFAELWPEDIASAASFLIALAATHGHLVPLALASNGVQESCRGIAQEMLTCAAHLSEIRELEISVFHVGFRCEWKGDRFFIKPPDAAFGMALNLGFVREATRERYAGRPDTPSFVDICHRLLEEFGDRLVRLSPDEPRRLQIMVGSGSVKEIGRVLLDEGLFREDEELIYDTCNELNVKYSDLKNHQLTPELTVLDVVLALRILRWFGTLRDLTLEKLARGDREVYWASSLGGSTPTEFVSMLEMHGLSPARASALLKLFTWNATSDSILDVQYTPIIQLGETLAIAFSALNHSNVIRNLLVSQRQRFFDAKDVDANATVLEASLRERTHRVATGMKYKYGQAEGDIDVIAELGGIIYIFECKNTILPCGPFEFRTFYDNLKKAAKQLARLQALWGDPAFVAYLESRLRWGLRPDTRLRCVIAPSTRVLSGTSIEGFPIRDCHEIRNQLRTGTVWHGLDGFGQVQSTCWPLGDFSVSTFDGFLSNGDVVYAPFWDAMAPGWASMLLPQSKTEIQTLRYSLDIDEYVSSARHAGPVRFAPQTSEPHEVRKCLVAADSVIRIASARHPTKDAPSGVVAE
jgi:hypothetical protein